MSKQKLRPIINASDDLWELARANSVIVFGFENRSGYIRRLIKQDKPNRYEI